MYANELFFVERSRQLRTELSDLREARKNEISALLRELGNLPPFPGQLQTDNEDCCYAALNAKRRVLRTEQGNGSQGVVSQALQTLRERESKETIGTQLAEVAATETQLRATCFHLTELCEKLWTKQRLLEAEVAKRSGTQRSDLHNVLLQTSTLVLQNRWKSLSALSS